MRERRQVRYAETEENEEDVPESATDDNRGSSEALEGHKSPRKSEAGKENASSRKRKAVSLLLNRALLLLKKKKHLYFGT